MREMVELQPMDWLVVIILVFLNWFRNAVGWSLVKCDDIEDKIALHICKAEDSIQLLTICGAIVFCFTLSLAIFGRIYELRILSTRNVKSARDYAPYLHDWERGKIAVSAKNKLNREAFKVLSVVAVTAYGNEKLTTLTSCGISLGCSPSSKDQVCSRRQGS